jgi:hypothetical protein
MAEANLESGRRAGGPDFWVLAAGRIVLPLLVPIEGPEEASCRPDLARRIPVRFAPRRERPVMPRSLFLDITYESNGSLQVFILKAGSLFFMRRGGSTLHGLFLQIWERRPGFHQPDWFRRRGGLAPA